MADYETLRIVWWLLLGALLIGFTITDGFDLGVGMLFRFLSRSDAERRVFLESIEPVWEGNQVWFILGGGAIFAAWPALYAASFSGFYGAMFLVLVALILRPVGFNFRNKLPGQSWRNTWDWCLFLAGAVPSLVFGVAIGNLFLGVPFAIDQDLRAHYLGNFFGLLRPFPLTIGMFSVAMLTMHGAAFAHLKTAEPMSQRAARAGRTAAVLVSLLAIGAGLWIAFGLEGFTITSAIDTHGPSNPLLKTVELTAAGWLANFSAHTTLIAAPAALVLLPAGVFVALGRGAARTAFLLTSLTNAAAVLTAGFALFPFLLPSSAEPSASLTVWDASSSRLTLSIMLYATAILLPIVLLYTAWAFRVLRGRVTLADDRQSGTNGAHEPRRH